MPVKIKRIYEPWSADDGYRILVDRLWPRGMKKEDARIDVWLKDVAPTTLLRKWFDHDAEKWDQFRQKYHAELVGSVVLKELSGYINEHKVVTLLYASREEKYNHAVVLQQFIDDDLQY